MSFSVNIPIDIENLVILAAQVSVDRLDQITIGITVLVLLSAVTEKLVQLVRKYPLQFQILNGIALVYLSIASLATGISCIYDSEYFFGITFFILTGIFVFLLFYAVKLFQGKEWAEQRNPLPRISKGVEIKDPIEKKSEINLLSILTGVAIAFFFQVNFFEIFSTNNEFTIWKNELIIDYIFFNTKLDISFSFLGGVLVTGFFLSFGSKFFHDLLDLIYDAKNARRKLKDEQTFGFQSAESLKEYRKLFAFEEIQRAIQANQHLRLKDNVLQIVPGVMTKNGIRVSCVDIFLKDNDTSQIPSSLAFSLNSGEHVFVPTSIYSHEKAAKAQYKIGDAISRKNSGFIGSLGPVLENENGEQLILTCAHVLNEGNSTAWNGDIPLQKQVSVYHNESKKSLGNCVFQKRNSQFDMALIENKVGLNNRIDSSRILSNEVYEANFSDNFDQPEIIIMGSQTQSTVGVLRNVNVPFHIEYEDQIVELQELHLVSRVVNGEFKTISKDGDSGSLVYMRNKVQPLGIVIGGTDTLTVVLPLTKICANQNLKISLK